MRSSRRRSVRPFVVAAAVVLGVLVVAGGLAAVRLFTIAHRLSDARTLIQSASADIEQGRLADGRTSLQKAEGLLLKSNSDLYDRTELELVGWMPGVSQNLDALRSSVALGLQMVVGGERLLDTTKPLEAPNGKIEVSLDQGKIPLPIVLRAQAQVDELETVLPDAQDKPSTSLLVGPVADLQRTVYREAGKRRAELADVGRGLQLLADMAGANGPRRYLIAVANPAEMRGAGGMVLSYGVLESKDGTFALGTFGPIDDLSLDQPLDAAAMARLQLPADYVARWGGLSPTQLWRNTTLNPDFSLDAPVMEAMYKAKTGQDVDGVIQVDPLGLAAILRGTGPVDVDGIGQVNADNVVDLTLNRAYIDFPNSDQRREVLGDVAKSTFKALVNGSFSSVRPFGEALLKAAMARHVVFDANASSAAQDLAYFHADGALPKADTHDYVVMTLQNFSKNKLDYYVDSSVSITGTRPAGQTGNLSLAVTVTNTVPANVASTYIMGPNAPDEQAGLYRGTVSLYLPNGTTVAGSKGADRSPTATTEAGRTVVTYDVTLSPGASSNVELDLQLVPRSARSPYSIALVPVPRVRPTALSVDLDLTDGNRCRRTSTPVVAPETLACTRDGGL